MSKCVHAPGAVVFGFVTVAVLVQKSWGDALAENFSLEITFRWFLACNVLSM